MAKHFCGNCDERITLEWAIQWRGFNGIKDPDKWPDFCDECEWILKTEMVEVEVAENK